MRDVSSMAPPDAILVSVCGKKKKAPRKKAPIPYVPT